MAVGTSVVSVYGGPADRGAFGETEDFTKRTIPKRSYNDVQLRRHALYDDVRELRDRAATDLNSLSHLAELKKLMSVAAKQTPNEWLIHTELLEIAENMKAEEAVRELLGHLNGISRVDASVAQHISDARRTLHGA
jgi:phenylalanine-4-hydroxylase